MSLASLAHPIIIVGTKQSSPTLNGKQDSRPLPKAGTLYEGVGSQSGRVCTQGQAALEETASHPYSCRDPN